MIDTSTILELMTVKAELRASESIDTWRAFTEIHGYGVSPVAFTICLKAMDAKNILAMLDYWDSFLAERTEGITGALVLVWRERPNYRRGAFNARLGYMPAHQQ